MSSSAVPNAVEWRESLRRDGYAQFPGLIPLPLVHAAQAAIGDSRRLAYDSRRQTEYDNRSYCPELLGTAPIMALLQDRSVQRLLDEAVCSELHHDQGQIAIRRAHNAATATDPTPHIDGIPTPHNGLDVNATFISNFTLLVGVHLSAVTRDFAGNFTIWPGSHHRLEQHLRQRGPRAMAEGMPTIALGSPRQLLGAPGDVVLCHYQLAHAAAVNLSADDRCMVFFRLWLRDIDERRWSLLTDIWQGWTI